MRGRKSFDNQRRGHCDPCRGRESHLLTRGEGKGTATLAGRERKSVANQRRGEGHCHAYRERESHILTRGE